MEAPKTQQPIALDPPREYLNYINGKWKPSRSGQWFENRNPADQDDLIGLFPLSTEEDVQEAVEAAREALRAGAGYPPRSAEQSFSEPATSSAPARRRSPAR